MFRAEAAATQFIVQQTAEQADITLDCKGVRTLILSLKQSATSMDLLQAKFGKENWWRHCANQLLDDLVGKTAEAGRNLTWEKQLRARDAVQMQVNRMLMKRMAAILEYDEDTGPQVKYKSEQVLSEDGEERTKDPSC